MDSSRRILNCLWYLALLALSGQAIAKQDLLLRELHWLGSDTDTVTALTQQPSECLNPEAPPSAKAGRLAFASPALLGGQAARMGLSCASCHPAGRHNPHFFIEGISGGNGTADVTHSFFSSTGGNQELTPVHIPDLADLPQNTIKNRDSAHFRTKLRQLIEVEFDGQVAPDTVFNALQSYLRHTDLVFCEHANKMHPIGLAQDWQDLLETVAIIQNSQKNENAYFFTRAARQQLEKIHERYAVIDNRPLNQGLVKLSRFLQNIMTQHPPQHTKTKKRHTQFKLWQQQAHQLHHLLQQQEINSTYNRQVLRNLIETHTKNNAAP